MNTNSTASMLKVSLPEFLEAAKYCTDYRKTEEKWGNYRTQGCLGYPAGVLLFSIIDSIGSYFKKNKDFKIIIDSKEETIDSAGYQHFKILNSKYFKQDLSADFIKALYSQFRSPLTHNSVLGKNSRMIPHNSILGNEEKGNAFFSKRNNKNEWEYQISTKELWELCQHAIEEFTKDIDNIVPNSSQGKN